MTTCRTVSTGRAAGAPDLPGLRLPEYVLGKARSRGSKTALIEAYSGREISYARLADTVSTTAGWLAEAGVRPGEVLAVCAPDSIEFVVAWHAALSAGAVVAAADHACAEQEIVAGLRRAGARWLITTADQFRDKMAAVARQVPGLAGILVLGAGASPLVCGAGLQLAIRRFDVRSGGGEPDEAADLSPDAAFLPTPRGTGRHETAVLTHQHLVADLDQLSRAQRGDDSDVTLAVVPMFPLDSMQSMVNAGLVRGATTVILPDLEFGAFLDAVQDYRVTQAEVTPEVAALLASSKLVDDCDLSSLRLLTSGPAPLGTDVARACAQRLGIRFVRRHRPTTAPA